MPVVGVCGRVVMVTSYPAIQASVVRLPVWGPLGTYPPGSSIGAKFIFESFIQVLRDDKLLFDDDILSVEPVVSTLDTFGANVANKIHC